MINFISKNLFFSLFSLSFIFLYAGGPIMGLLLEHNGHYRAFSIHAVVQGFGFYFIFLAATLFINKLKLTAPHLRITYHNPDRLSRALYIAPLIVSGTALLLYFQKNGLVITSLDGYESRYTSNLGLGAYTLAMQLFYLFAAGVIFARRNIPTKTLLLASLFFFIITFLVLGGHRQLGLGVSAGIFIYLAIEKRISKNILGATLLAILAISLASAIFRHDHANFNFSAAVNTILIYFYDGLTPLDAHVQIVQHSNYYRLPGAELIANQFFSYIPRFLWPNKPDFVLNGGNYYTFEILGRSAFVTYSPTLIGELILTHGPYFYLIAPVLAIIVSELDRKVHTRTYFGIVLIIYSPILAFNLYREGFYVFLSKLTIIYIIGKATLLFSCIHIRGGHLKLYRGTQLKIKRSLFCGKKSPELVN